MNDYTYYEKIPSSGKNFPVRLLFHKTDTGFSAHWHEHLELLFFKEGGCSVTCGGKTFEAKENDLVVVNSNELHFFEKGGTGNYFCAIINPSFFADVDFENILISPHISGDKFIKDCFNEMFMENYSMNEGYDMQIKGIVYRLMTHILRNYKAETLSQKEVSVKKNRMIKINDILSYISEHYNSKITTSSLAQKFYLNEHYFCHFFKEATGQSPIGYINRLRTEKAAVLLKNTNLNITQTAMNVGFENLNYFTRVFKKYMGMTPREYKNLY